MMRSKKTFFRFFVFLMLISVFLGRMPKASDKVYASNLEGITSERIESMKNEVADAKKEQASIQNSISDMEKLASQLATEKKNLDKYIAKLDISMSELVTKITGFEEKISQKELEIVQKQQELESALEQEENQYASMKERIQCLYEAGNSSYFETILKADSFSDMLNKAQYVEEMAAYDNKMLHQYIMQREYIALCKEILEQEKITLDESKKALDTEKKNLQSIRTQKQQDLAVYEDNIRLTEESIKELEADLKFQTELISSLEKEITDEQREILKQNGISLGYEGGGFACPAPSYVSISSEFGWRSDPFTGYRAYHNGIDMAAAEGTPIVAAYDGIVGQAGYNSSMGNYVYLEHGNGLRTIYLHASKLYVKQNDVVLKGEQIAAVGSTGRSTGPHLHFSVRLNGEYVSPWDYLSR